MKKALGVIIMAAMCWLPCGFASAQDAVDQNQQTKDPVGKLTGEVWQKTSADNKLAYLYGLESAIQIEKYISEKFDNSTSKKRRPYTLSPFEKGWMDAFVSTGREQIMQEVDKWYADHPDQLARPVLDVIWYELIVPRLQHNK